MKRITSLYPLALSIGLTAGLYGGYVVLTRVCSMAALEAAVAEDEFQAQIQKRADSPDGRWTAYLIRNRGMDNCAPYCFFVEPRNEPARRVHIGDSRKNDFEEYLALNWSADSSQVTAYAGKALIATHLTRPRPAATQALPTTKGS